MSSFEGISIRLGTVLDLPIVQNLIRSSWEALVTHTSVSMKDFFDQRATASIEQEFVEERFHTVYNSLNTANKFWVADSQDGVLGCVALHKLNVDEGDLLRMAVSPSARSRGVGQLLVKELFSYCREQGYLRIHCGTGNPDAARFYNNKCGFSTVESKEFKTPLFKLTGVFSVKFLAEKVIRHVTIIGGTHGNERIGIELLRQWSSSDSAAVKRSSFQTLTILGNPAAVSLNRRYVASDLNRQFAGNDVSKVSDDLEGERAKELYKLLGVQGQGEGGNGNGNDSGERYGTDFIIDLHSTTSDMGLVAMTSALTQDCFAFRVAHHLKQSHFPDLRVTTISGTKTDAYSVDSLSPSGLAFEVGPLPHGTLNSALMESTRTLVLRTLDFIEEHNQRCLQKVQAGKATLRHVRGRDIVDIIDENENEVEGKGEYPTLEVHEYFTKVDFPRHQTTTAGAGVVAGEGEGVASTSTDSTTSSSTDSESLGQVQGQGQGHLSAIIHPSLEGKNWCPIEEGQPAFISIDGKLTDIPFVYPENVVANSAQLMPASKEQLYPMFINEAAYYEKGTAFVLTKRIQKNIC